MADSKRLDPFCGFDLGEYRYAVAKFLKLLIRAREKDEPGFLAEDEYRRWGLQEILQDPQSQETIVAMMAAAQDHLWRVFLGPHGSGGVPVGDPLAALKEGVAYFAGEVDTAAIQDQLRQGEPIDWAAIVDWERLPAIRAGLDSLPHPRQQSPLSATDRSSERSGDGPPAHRGHDGGNTIGSEKEWWHKTPADPQEYACGRIEGTLKELADALEVDPRTLESMNQKGVVWVQRLHARKWVLSFKDSEEYKRAWKRLDTKRKARGEAKPHENA